MDCTNIPLGEEGGVVQGVSFSFAASCESIIKNLKISE